MLHTFSLQEIEEVSRSFPEDIIQSPLEYHARLSKKYGADVFLKREDRQAVRSYKIRGAYTVISQTSAEERKGGFVAASAGNHAQGFAYSCKLFKTTGVVFMPTTTPLQKIQATRKFGGDYTTIEIVGNNFDEAQEQALAFCAQNNMTFIPAFDHPEIIKGQASCGLEILTQNEGSDIDYIFCPIGGGGLIAGLSEVFLQSPQNPIIIGCEPQGAPAAYHSLERGSNVVLESIDTFVDGASVKAIGTHTFPYIQKNINTVNLVPEGRLCSTIIELLQEDGLVLEPAGVLAIDSLKDYKEEIRGKRVICIASGSNLDFERLNEIKERSLQYEGLKKYLIINFVQRGGALKEFLDTLPDSVDIERFEYLKKNQKEKGPALVGLRASAPETMKSFMSLLAETTIEFRDITHDQMFFEFIV